MEATVAREMLCIVEELLLVSLAVLVEAVEYEGQKGITDKFMD